MPRGRLFVFEGADGVGKSALISWFLDYLTDSGVAATQLSFPDREPGTLGSHVYELHHFPGRFGIAALEQTSLQLLHVAAHIDSIERRIKPILAEGRTVLLDRYWWSTFVYGLVGGVPRTVLERMIDLEKEVWRPIKPDAVFLIARSKPLRQEPLNLWGAWVDAYHQLANVEAKSVPVILVNNDDVPVVAQQHILRYYAAQDRKS